MDLSHGMDSSWHEWVQHNLSRGCDILEMAGILAQHGFSSNLIASELGVAAANSIGSAVDHKRLAQVNLTRSNQAIVTDKLQLYTIPHFLSDAECDQLVALANQRLRPSTLTIQPDDYTYRNSKTSDLCLMDDPVVGIVDNRIAHTLGIQLSYAEGTQAQRYDVGEQFKQHTDFFQPGTPEYQKFAGVRGNRTWTFMIYLNNVECGGGTRFFAIDKTFIPKKGTAVIWNNLYPDGRVNPDTLHSGLPVEAGCKLIITKWFREFGNGPMFSI